MRGSKGCGLRGLGTVKGECWRKTAEKEKLKKPEGENSFDGKINCPAVSKLSSTFMERLS